MIRLMIESDVPKIKELFLSDVYHWSRWVVPVLRYGVVSLFARPIALAIGSICAIACCWDAKVAFLLALALFLQLVVLWLVQLLSHIGYFWLLPEFASDKNNNNINKNSINNKWSEYYSKDGFFVAELEGRIVGCVGVKKSEQEF